MNQPLTTPHVIRPIRRSRQLMRVALVTESYPPEVNGVANSVARVVEGLRARQHAVQLVRPSQGQHEAGTPRDERTEVLTPGVPIPLYGQLRMGLPSARRLEQLWSRHRPDVVHIATEGPLGWSALRAALKLKLPVCSEFRTNFQAYSQFYGIGWMHQPIMAYLRSFHNRGHATMVPTDALKKHLGQQGFRSLAVVARGVDTQLFSPANRSSALRASWGVRDEDPVALYVGRLAPEKNLGALTTAFAQITASQPRARLVVVGDGPSRKELELACPHAIFAGFRTGKDLAAHYASSDLFLFPSLTETFGNVTLEAMASGLAVVAFHDAGAGQLIQHDVNGLLAPKGDVQALTQLAGHTAIHRDVFQRLGAAARQSAMGLGWDNIMRNIEDVYVATVAHAGDPGMPRVWAQMQGG